MGKVKLLQIMKYFIVAISLIIVVSGCEQIKFVKNKITSKIALDESIDYYISDANYIKNASTFSKIEWIELTVKQYNLSESSSSQVIDLLNGVFNRIEVQSDNILRNNKKEFKKFINQVRKGKNIYGTNYYEKLEKDFREGIISGKSIEILLNSMISQYNSKVGSQFFLNTVQLKDLREMEIINSDFAIYVIQLMNDMKHNGMKTKDVKRNLHEYILNGIMYNYSKYLDHENIVNQMI